MNKVLSGMILFWLAHLPCHVFMSTTYGCRNICFSVCVFSTIFYRGTYFNISLLFITLMLILLRNNVYLSVVSGCWIKFRFHVEWITTFTLNILLYKNWIIRRLVTIILHFHYKIILLTIKFRIYLDCSQKCI